MGRLVKKIAFLSGNLDFLRANKEFLTYFESAEQRCEHFLDLVLDSEKQFFIKAVESRPEPGQIFHFQLKKNTGEYRNNVVYLLVEGDGENKSVTVTAFDIEELLLFNFENSHEERCLRRALSISDEYFFNYDDKNSNFKIFHYHQNAKIIDVNQNLDEWAKSIVEKKLVDEASISKLDVFVHDLKAITASSAVTIKCGVRTQASNMLETLRFISVAVSDDSEDAAIEIAPGNIKYGSFVVGRILSEDAVKQAQKSTSLIKELQFDSLTNIYNKKTITEFAKTRISSNKNDKVALVIVDLDHFKPVNDVYGHLSGDAVLSKAASILKDLVGDDGYAGRFGGDEFMLLVENLNSEPILRGFLRSIQSSIKLAFEKMFDGIQITASIGCAVHPVDGETFEELFKKADFCLYRAKNKGRDRYVFYREDLHREEYEQMTGAQSEGGKIEVRDVLELQYMNKFFTTLNKEPEKAVNEILTHMIDGYKLDNISIYYGKDLKKVYQVGEDVVNSDNALYALTDEFKAQVTEEGYAKIDFVTGLSEETSGNLKKTFMEQKIKSCAAFILGDKENIKGLIVFARTRYQQLFANYEFDCISMFSSAMNLNDQKIIEKLI